MSRLPEAVHIAVHRLVDDLILRCGVTIVKGVLNATRELLVRCDDNDDVPVRLQSPEE